MATPADTSVPLTPVRTADSASPDLQHPTPGLQSLQGAFSNIERLEEHAERMSERGSDLGEEIRKLHLEQKLSDSRRSSLLSASVADEPIRSFDTRARGASTSSFRTNSIVDLNGAARWGGYSPGGYASSPAGSLRSSVSQPTALQRQRSNSKPSRLDHITRVDEEQETMQKIDEHPRSPHVAAGNTSNDEQSPVSSFAQKYEDIAQEIQQELRNSVLLEVNNDVHQHQELSPSIYPDDADLPDRPPTSASTDTTHKLGTLWQDFDGTHCPDTVEEEPELEREQEPVRGTGSRESALLKLAPDMAPGGAPPPEDGMVYYPAPVPRMLNLPKRLSKLPNANHQAKRRTQLLESMQDEHRKSAPWLEKGAEPGPSSNRKSRNLANLPPALRASAYFDAPAPAQEYEVKGGSAQDTLNNILEASAHAPVSAFTDHPIAGHMGDEVYGREKKHKRTGSKANELEKIEKVESRKSRSSLHLLDTRRNSSGDMLNKLQKRNSSTNLDMLTVRASESRMSLANELEQDDPDARGPEAEHEVALDSDHEASEEEQEQEYFGPPTTLLAELQMRKAQQKSRNLTAATAFPNGMHSTLLQLDAVAEIEKKKRIRQKVNLAWETPEHLDQAEDSDEDVPLGMLFPGREGLVNKKQPGLVETHDWDRPLGLMEQREMENNEPLSQRKSRLFGAGDRRNTRMMDPTKRNTQYTELNFQSQQHLAVPTETAPQPESDDEGEGETLAQRMRRMKDQQALDDTIVDVRKSVVSNDFAADLMSQFGVSEDKPKPAASPAADGEEETLGQRRARLQAEALARGDANPHGTRPPLRSSMSMADILNAHPIDPNNTSRQITDEQLVSSLPQGSLLRANAEKQEQRRVSKIDLNRRISSYALDQPLLGEGVGKIPDDVPLGAKIQAYKNKMAGTGTPLTAPAATPRAPSVMFGNSPGLPGMNLNASMSALNLTTPTPGNRDSYFPQAQTPMMGMGMGVATPGSGYGMPNPQMMALQMNMMGVPMNGMQGMAYPQVSGSASGSGGMRASTMMPPQMGMGGMMMPGMMPQMGMPAMNMGIGAGLVGVQSPAAMGMGRAMGMPVGVGLGMMEAPMDPRQRDQIDRWRNSVMH